MSENNKPGNDPEPPADEAPKSGLSVSGEELESRSIPRRPKRRRTGLADTLLQGARVDAGTAARWLLPVAALVVVLLLVTLALSFSHGGRLTDLDNEVAALKAQTARTDPGPEIERLATRLEQLRGRLDAVDELTTRVAALQDRLQEQSAGIEALRERVAGLEQAPAPTAEAEQAPGADQAPDTEQAQEPDSGGTEATSAPPDDAAPVDEWVINLMTLADPASAQSFRERLEELGIDARIETTTRGDQTLQRVVVPGFTSRDAAQDAVPGLTERLELSDQPWITRQTE